MAEESRDLVITTPEKAEPEADYTMENPGSLIDDCSTEAFTHIASSSTDSADTFQKSVSRYLKPRFDSCHDFCKYGKQRDDESKEKLLKALGRKVMPNECDFVQVTVSNEDKTEKNVMHKPLVADNITDSHDVNTIRSLESNINTSSDKKKGVMKMKKTSEDSRYHIYDLKHSPSEKFSSLKPLTSSDTKVDHLRPNASSDKKGSSLSRNNVSFSKKSPSSTPPGIIKVELVKSERAEKQNSLTNDKLSRSMKKTDNLSSKVCFSTPVKSQSVKPKQPPRSNSTSDRVHGKARRNSHYGAVDKIKASANKAPEFLSATSYPNFSLTKREFAKAKKGGSSNVVSSLKSLSNNTRGIGTYAFNNEKVSEKVLYVIKTEGILDASHPANDENTSPPSSNSPSRPKGSCLSPHGEEYSDTDELISNGNETREPENGELLEENSSSKKLKFKGGKVVDIICGDNTPMRLRFKQARTLNTEDGESDLKKRNFKKSESNNDDDAADAQSSSGIVVLKRQDVQNKKDARRLLNNVIEETASKLVENRKSKVQALVGAFETVISLHESKPSSSSSPSSLTVD